MASCHGQPTSPARSLLFIYTTPTASCRSRLPLRVPLSPQHRSALSCSAREKPLTTPPSLIHDLRRGGKASAADQQKGAASSSSFPRLRPAPLLEIGTTAISKSFLSCRSQMKRQSKRPTSSLESTEPGTMIAAGSPLFYVLMIASVL
jgi:hypothetical protein